jgi:hypothetical protein
LIGSVHDQGMVQKRRRCPSAQQPREANLPAGGRQQIDPSDDEVDALPEIVHRDRELVGPVAEPIADEHVTALQRWVLLLRSKPLVDESLDARIDPHAPAMAVNERQSPTAAAAGVPQFRGSRIEGRESVLDLAPGAITTVYESLRCEDVHRLAIDRVAIALAAAAAPRAKAGRGEDVGAIAEPVEIVEDARFVLGTAALAIVILDAQKDLPRACRAEAASRRRRVRVIVDLATRSSLQPAGISVGGNPVERDGNPGPQRSGRVTDDLTFEFATWPGRGYVRLLFDAPGWKVKAIRYKGVDVTDAGIDFKEGQEVSGIEVELAKAEGRGEA